MFKRSKSKDETTSDQAPSNSAPRASSESGEVFEMPIFDGKGNRAIMTFSADSSGRVIQRVKKGRGFKAYLSHIVK